MAKSLEFRTSLSKEKIIELLRKNTHHTESILQPSFFFGEELLFGQITEDRIRVGNASRVSRDPCPIFEIVLSPNEVYTDIIIYDDTEDRIAMGRTLLWLTGMMSVVFFIIGSVLSFKQPDHFSFLWTIIVCSVIIMLGVIGVYLNKMKLSYNQKEDLKLLTKLLKK